MTIDERVSDIREHPERHQHHDLNTLTQCCVVDGAVSGLLMEAHTDVSTRSNGGIKCDVFDGPCACGAWHTGGR